MKLPEFYSIAPSQLGQPDPLIVMHDIHGPHAQVLTTPMEVRLSEFLVHEALMMADDLVERPDDPAALRRPVDARGYAGLSTVPCASDSPGATLLRPEAIPSGTSMRVRASSTSNARRASTGGSTPCSRRRSDERLAEVMAWGGGSDDIDDEEESDDIDDEDEVDDG